MNEDTNDAVRAVEPAEPQSAGADEDAMEADDAQATAADQPSPALSGAALFPLVAVGASAGGLSAFTRLLRGLPADSGMAFVLIQHLAPDHDSHLAALLARDCALPIADAVDGVAVEPGHVYVITPNTELTMSAGVLRTRPRDLESKPHLPIDIFFSSLASERGEFAVGVVLSGEGSDGTLGLAEIRAAGGITFAQDERSSEHRSMPASASADGCVDFVLPPEEIAAELTRIGPIICQQGPAGESPPPTATDEDDLHGVLALLGQESGIDFSQYRASTLSRRIHRRLVLAGDATIGDYLRRLRGNRAEISALFKDVLINVTTFFRDGEVFAALAAQVLPALAQRAAQRSPLKIWVIGCSTGQEVYSLAIELLDGLDGRPDPPELRIFATDVSDWALSRARAGWYPESVAAAIPPERLARYFVRESGGYRISKRIRGMCVFARHDLTGEIPLSKMDLIACRNVLIYLSPQLQLRILPTLAFALNPGGHLLLGSAETVGRSADLFEVVNQRCRIYRRKATTVGLHPPVFPTRVGLPAPLVAQTSLLDLQRTADRIVLERFAPAGVLINDDLDIIQFRGRASHYLEPAQGRASLNVLAMVPVALSLELRSAITAAKASGSAVSRQRIPLRDGSILRLVDLEVIPVHQPSTNDGCLLVLFADSPNGAPTVPVEPSNLAKELTTSNEYLKSLIEQNSAINDQLRYVNEEAVSSNEELRCMNEEAQTAKEELESANEEMASLNEEMTHRNGELSLLSADLSNLLDSLTLPVLLVDGQRCLRRVTETAHAELGLNPNDLGRTLESLELGFRLPELASRIDQVMATRTPASIDVRRLNGDWSNLRIHPCRDGDGAVLSLIDISEIHRTQERLQVAGDFARAVIETIPDPVLVLTSELRITVANRAFQEAFAIAPEACLGRVLYELGDRGWDTPELHGLLDRLRDEGQLVDVEVKGEFAHLGKRTMRLNARRILSEDGDGPMLLLALTDITRLTAMADDLKGLSQDLLRSNADLDQFAAVASHDLQEPLRMVVSYLQLLQKRYGSNFDAKASEYIAFAVDGAHRMSLLVSAILEYSRIGKVTLPALPVDLGSVLREAVTNLGRAVVTAQAKITIASMPRVAGTAVMLVQVFQNLLANAVKFRAPDRPLEIDVRSVERDGQATITIADNGIGIEEKNFERVFELFERLNPRTAYPGTGIGLATAKKIVERHGGRIAIASTVDVGTVVSVTLPLAE